MLPPWVIRIIKIFKKEKLVRIIEEHMKMFDPKISKNDARKKKQLIYSDCRKYHATPLEWYLFDFEARTESEKENYLSDYYKNLWSVNDNKELYWELTDKYWFYNKNKEFFKRNAILLDENTSFEEFESFCKKNCSVFIKPLTAAFGYNTFKYDYNPDDIVTIFERLRKDKNTYKPTSLTKFGFIIEELIIQDEHLKVFNQSSVNTVRIPSVLTPKGHYVLGCFFRTGRKGAVIDNAGGGGIFAAIDSKTGIAITDGYDERRNSYICHPDSGIVYKGFKIKDWDKLLEITETAHKKMSNHKYIAYDFAYTEKGWVMLEGNFGQFISQFATKQGLKSEFQKLMFE